MGLTIKRGPGFLDNLVDVIGDDSWTWCDRRHGNKYEQTDSLKGVNWRVQVRNVDG